MGLPRDREILKTVTERDADLALLQLLTGSKDFALWFLNQLGISLDLESNVEVWHSVVDNTGESDLEIGIEKGGKRIIVLIEDKIDAVQQPRQAERYVERGEKYIGKQWDDFVICLVAPEEYIGEKEKEAFQNIIRYEDILEVVHQELDIPNKDFIVEILTTAIEKSERSWEPEKDEEMTQFKQFYWKIARKHAPELQIEKPENIPTNSVWMEMNPSIMEGRDQITHKMKKGIIDLQLDADRFDIHQVQEKIEDTDFYAQKSDSGATIFIRQPVPPIQNFANPEQHEGAIREALNKALTLRKIYLQLKQNQS